MNSVVNLAEAMDHKSRTQESLSAVSLFSGAGGMDIGFRKAGFKIQWANDFDKAAVQTYKQNICDMINDGFNIIPVLDHLEEIDYYKKHAKADIVNLGIRISTEEEPSFMFYTSRLGIRSSEIMNLYNDKIKTNPKFTLKIRL